MPSFISVYAWLDWDKRKWAVSYSGLLGVWLYNHSIILLDSLYLNYVVLPAERQLQTYNYVNIYWTDLKLVISNGILKTV